MFTTLSTSLLLGPYNREKTPLPHTFWKVCCGYPASLSCTHLSVTCPKHTVQKQENLKHPTNLGITPKEDRVKGKTVGWETNNCLNAAFACRASLFHIGSPTKNEDSLSQRVMSNACRLPVKATMHVCAHSPLGCTQYKREGRLLYKFVFIL